MDSVSRKKMRSVFWLLWAVAMLPAVVAGQAVVINKYYNGGPGFVQLDALELLVVQNNLDLRGYIVKDFSGSMGAEGGAFRFRDVALWAAVPAGTLIVLRNDVSADDVSALPDFTLSVGLNNFTYFVYEGGSFDISTTDMLMLKAPGSAVAGVLGSVHVLAGGAAGTLFTAAPQPKLIATATSGSAQYVYANNSTSTLADYDGNGATGGATGLAFGLANNASNQTYIALLRGGVPGAVAINSYPATLSFGEVTTGQQLTLGALVTGQGLSAGITASVTAGSPYLLSSDNILYQTTASLPATGGAIYARFSPTASTVNNAVITLTSGATTQAVALTGSGFTFNPNTPIVVNKFYNGNTDAVELLVLKNNADLRGLLIKDFSDNLAGDGGGAYRFTQHAVWGSLPAGTLIVLRKNASASDVTAADFSLDVGMDNSTYFDNLILTQTFDLSGSDMVMLKAAGSAIAGTAGSLHALACGVQGAQYLAAPAPKLWANTAAGESSYVLAETPGAAVADFHGAAALGGQPTAIWGVGNTAGNIQLIQALRTTTALPAEQAEQDGAALLYPNPASEAITLRYISARAGRVVMNLYNAEGGAVHRAELYLSRPGMQLHTISVATLPPGLYLLQLHLPAEDKRYSFRVSVVR